MGLLLAVPHNHFLMSWELDQNQPLHTYHQKQMHSKYFK
jgi:hypothetical protein